MKRIKNIVDLTLYVLVCIWTFLLPITLAALFAWWSANSYLEETPYRILGKGRYQEELKVWMFFSFVAMLLSLIGLFAASANKDKDVLVPLVGCTALGSLVSLAFLVYLYHHGDKVADFGWPILWTIFIVFASLIVFVILESLLDDEDEKSSIEQESTDAIDTAEETNEAQGEAGLPSAPIETQS